MEKLFGTYRLQDIVLFIVVLVLAVKEIITLVDWYKARIKKEYSSNKELLLEERLCRGAQKMNDLSTEQENIKKQLDQINSNVQLLIESDKDDIKSWLTERYHYFKKLGKIDSYSLDCIEKRYEHYKDEKGNSFIASLMSEIRDLPIE